LSISGGTTHLGYPKSYARDDIPVITHYANGQTTSTPQSIDFVPGQQLGSVSGGLGLRQYLQSVGHTFVIDPLKVTRAALESAASVAALFITTETAIVEEVIGNLGAIIAFGFGDLAEGMIRPSNIY
jgi:hypothetical protein